MRPCSYRITYRSLPQATPSTNTCPRIGVVSTDRVPIVGVEVVVVVVVVVVAVVVVFVVVLVVFVVVAVVVVVVVVVVVSVDVVLVVDIVVDVVLELVLDVVVVVVVVDVVVEDVELEPSYMDCVTFHISPSSSLTTKSYNLLTKVAPDAWPL